VAPSVGNREAAKLTGGLAPLDVDVVYDSQLRSALTPLQNTFNGRSVSFKDGLNRSVGSVADPSAHAKSIRRALGFHAEKNPLNPAGYDHMGSDLVFHGDTLSETPQEVSFSIKPAASPAGGCAEP